MAEKQKSTFENCCIAIIVVFLGICVLGAIGNTINGSPSDNDWSFNFTQDNETPDIQINDIDSGIVHTTFKDRVLYISHEELKPSDYETYTYQIYFKDYYFKDKDTTYDVDLYYLDNEGNVIRHWTEKYYPNLDNFPDLETKETNYYKIYKVNIVIKRFGVVVFNDTFDFNSFNITESHDILTFNSSDYYDHHS